MTPQQDRNASTFVKFHTAPSFNSLLIQDVLFRIFCESVYRRIQFPWPPFIPLNAVGLLNVDYRKAVQQVSTGVHRKQGKS